MNYFCKMQSSVISQEQYETSLANIITSLGGVPPLIGIQINLNRPGLEKYIRYRNVPF